MFKGRTEVTRVRCNSWTSEWFCRFVLCVSGSSSIEMSLYIRVTRDSAGKRRMRAKKQPDLNKGSEEALRAEKYGAYFPLVITLIYFQPRKVWLQLSESRGTNQATLNICGDRLWCQTHSRCTTEHIKHWLSAVLIQLFIAFSHVTGSKTWRAKHP